jgi:hypothetical protein
MKLIPIRIIAVLLVGLSNYIMDHLTSIMISVKQDRSSLNKQYQL